jgi:hypothetical protein
MAIIDNELKLKEIIPISPSIEGDEVEIFSRSPGKRYEIISDHKSTPQLPL